MQALKIVKTKDISHEEWLAARKNGIGGSDASVVAGINKYKSAIALWLEKTGQAPEEDLSENESVYWGTVLEDIVAQEFSNRTGYKVRRKNAILQHPEHSFMLANIDREIVGLNQGLECKTAGPYAKNDWEGDSVPDYYYLQVQHYCAVCGFDGMWIAVLIGGQRFVHKYVQRDQEVIEQLIKIESDFWKHVQNKTMPAIEGTEACAEALKKLYPEGNGQQIELPETAELWIRQRELAVNSINEATSKKDEAENALKLMLGEAEKGVVNSRVVEWKMTKGRESFDSKRFKIDQPSIYSQYVKIGESSRRFAVK